MPERILDLTRLLPGPLAGQILQAMGFRVLRLVPPAGDWLQGYAPQTHQWLQAGKDCETLDLKTEAGRQRLLHLAGESAALLENSLPGTMERLGVGPELLRAAHPHLVYVRLSGYRDPAAAARPGHDLTYLASAGLLDRLDPAWRSLPLADLCGGFWAALAVLNGLRAGGGFYQVSLEAALATAAWPPLAGLDGTQCCYAVYPAAEGRVALAALEPHLWRRFCAAAGRDAWLDAASSPAAPSNPVFQQIATMFLERSADAWDAWAAAAGVPLRALRLAPATPWLSSPWTART